MPINNRRFRLSQLPAAVILVAVSLMAFGQNSGAQVSEEGLFSTLPTANFKATATSNSELAELAIDGDTDTRWTSSQGQRPGQVFQVDLGDIYEFNEINLFHATPDQGPAQLRVAVSLDGKSWRVLSRGAGGSDVTTMKFSNLSARYIRIVQKGWKVKHKWSIDELTVKNEPKPESTPERPQISPTIIPTDLRVLPTDSEASNFLTASSFGPTLDSINELTSTSR